MRTPEDLEQLLLRLDQRLWETRVDTLERAAMFASLYRRLIALIDDEQYFEVRESLYELKEHYESVLKERTNVGTTKRDDRVDTSETGSTD